MGSPLDDVNLDRAASLERWKAAKQAHYEDRAFRYVLTQLGIPPAPLARRMKELSGEAALTFYGILDAYPMFPCWLGARNVPYCLKDFNLANCWNRYTRTRVFQAWEEVKLDAEEWSGPVGLIFTSPRIRGGRGMLIHHNMSVPVADDDLQVIRKLRNETYVTERLEVFIGRLRGGYGLPKGDG